MKSNTPWSEVGQLLASVLHFSPLEAVRIPFSVGEAAGREWEILCLEPTRDGGWFMEAKSTDDLLVEWRFDHFPATACIEVYGRVRNVGARRVRINNPRAWNVELQFPNGETPPWSRTFAGASCISVVFPPPDFSMSDVQFVEAIQAWSGVILDSGSDGRSSFHYLPCHIISNGPRTQGLACLLEWSGHWGLYCAPTRAYSPRSPEGFALRWSIGMKNVALDLAPGEEVNLPCTMVTSFRGGLDAGAQSVRNHITKNVSPDLAGEPFLPPTSFNHWFGFENDFTAATLSPSVRIAAELGLETFCVDGGWFKEGFRKGIGNWDEGDPAKFPEGIQAFSDFVRSHGLKYGTWFEPEFAHRDSEFYKAHPDWCWETPTLEEGLPYHGPWLSPGDRETHLVNFGLPEVQNWWVERFIRAYKEWGMRWVRWDCNQALSPNWEGDARSGDLGRRQIAHIQGLYKTWDAIREQCPELVIEQCASGGRRIDLGTIRRGHIFWMNDFTSHSDMVRAFQMNLNRLLPGNYANTNLCQNREEYSNYDILSHGMGGFGFSGRLEDLTAETRRRLKQFVENYKSYRHLLLGEYECLEGPGAHVNSPSRARFSNEKEEIVFTFNQSGISSSVKTSVLSNSPLGGLNEGKGS